MQRTSSLTSLENQGEVHSIPFVSLDVSVVSDHIAPHFTPSPTPSTSEDVTRISSSSSSTSSLSSSLLISHSFKEAHIGITTGKRKKFDEIKTEKKEESIPSLPKKIKEDLPFGASFEYALSTDQLVQLIRENKHQSLLDRFKKMICNHSFFKNKDMMIYKQYLNWVAKDGSIHPMRIEFTFTNDFTIQDEHQDASTFHPSSWLFLEASGTLRKPEGFRQIDPHYEMPEIKYGEPKYYNIAVYERNTIRSVAYVFASRCGKAAELVNLKKGERISGKEIFKIAKTYLFGLFPASRPILADMAALPVSSAQEKKLGLLKVLLKIIGVLRKDVRPERTGKTYYENLDNVTLVEGEFKTAYNRTICQNKIKRAQVIKELQEYNLADWSKLLSKTNKSILLNLYQKYFPVPTLEEIKEDKKTFETTTIQDLVTKIYEASLNQPGVSDDTIQFILLLGQGLDFSNEPYRAIEARKGTLTYFRTLVNELVWNSLIWAIHKDVEPAAAEEKKEEASRAVL